MGAWMDQQLKIGEPSLPNRSQMIYGSVDASSVPNGEEGTIADLELHPESNSELSDAATLEQRRAYKLEMQVCVWFIDVALVLSFAILCHHMH